MKSSPWSPQKDKRGDEPESATAGMKNAPSPNRAARFGRRGLRRRARQTAVGRHHHENRIGPICEQDHDAEQPFLLFMNF